MPDTRRREAELHDSCPNRVSVVVPIFNNAGSLPELHRRLVSTLRSAEYDFEIVYVNDGSRDDSLTVVRRLAGSDARIVIADLSRNFGQSPAVLAGFSLASGAIIVTIDADLENHPEDIPKLVGEVADGADLACGVRGVRHAPLLSRRGPSWLANRLVNSALALEIRDWGCGLNAVTSVVVRQILERRPMPKLPKVEAAMLASRVAQVNVASSVREYGRSGYTVARLGRFAATFLEDFPIGRSLRRILYTVAGVGIVPLKSADGSPVVAVGNLLLSLACWLVLSAAAVLTRVALLPVGKRPATAFTIRSVNGAAAPFA